MTGEQLFKRLQEKGITPTHYTSTGWAITWENSGAPTKASYNFFVQCTKPFSGEDLYNRVQHTGVLSSQYSWSEQPPFMQNYYNAIAEILLEKNN